MTRRQHWWIQVLLLAAVIALAGLLINNLTVNLIRTGLGLSFRWLSRPCLLYTSPSPRDLSTSRMPSSA